jgi:hypothetical protein
MKLNNRIKPLMGLILNKDNEIKNLYTYLYSIKEKMKQLDQRPCAKH